MPTASVALPPDWTLIARDAFNGVLLWTRLIEDWQIFGRPIANRVFRWEEQQQFVEGRSFRAVRFGTALEDLGSARPCGADAHHTDGKPLEHDPTRIHQAPFTADRHGARGRLA